jgi:hypothetical protein
VALRAFIATLESFAERKQFAKRLLATHVFGRSIRYEIHQEVVLPVLLEGYRNKQPWALYWLAGTGVDPARVDGKGSLALLKECFQLDRQSERVRDALLHMLLRGFSYSAHEWPAGILWGKDGATLGQCEAIIADIALARELDGEHRHTAYIDDYEEKVLAYRARLRARKRP